MDSSGENPALTHLVDATPIVLGDIRVPNLFRDLPEAVIVATTDRKISWINKSFLDMFGYEMDELIGLSSATIYADPDVFLQQGREHFSQTPTASDHLYEVTYKRKNGKEFLSQTTGGPIRDNEGKAIGYFAIIKDISKTRALETLLHKLFHISADQSLETEEKIHQIMQLGCDHFQTDSALVSWVHDGIYTILYSYSEIADIPRGTTFPLGETYCSKMLEKNEPLACHCAKDSNFASHPCYNLFLLETYIGVPLLVGGNQFGTLNFTSPDARHPFEEQDLEVIKMFAAWIGQLLSFEKATKQLPEVQ